VNAKENLWRALTHDDPEYVPVRRLNGQIPGLHRMQYRGSRPAVTGETDRWGVRWSPGTPAGEEWEPEVQGYALAHPLPSLDNLDDFPFPDPNEPGLVEGLLDGVNRNEVLVAGELYFPVFDRAHLMTGVETLFVAMSEQPQAVHRLLARITDYQIGILRRYIALGVDVLRCADDYGGQSRLLISPGMWRQFVKPQLARIFRVAKSAGLIVWLHSCGHVMDIVPDLIDIGLDVLDPLQTRANDQAEFKRRYGDRLCLMGGLDTQQVMALGTPEDVTAEVRRRIELLGPGGGFILAPDTLIPVPEANYRAYLAAGERYGRYPLPCSRM
jgi:uroporphyrinogen decarboxylase